MNLWTIARLLKKKKKKIKEKTVFEQRDFSNERDNKCFISGNIGLFKINAKFPKKDCRAQLV